MAHSIRSRVPALPALLSGGERQMLPISRALLPDPSFLLLDDPTAPLSPLYQQQIIDRIDSLREQGITVLIVEQNARLSLSRSDRGYIMASGKMVHTGDASHILTDPEIAEYFLGGTSQCGHSIPQNDSLRNWFSEASLPNGTPQPSLRSLR